MTTSAAAGGASVAVAPRAATKRAALGILLLLVNLASCAHQRPSPQKARALRRDASYAKYLLWRIENSRQALAPTARLGVALVGEDGALLVGRHADELFTPASTAKVLSGTAALKILGPSYRYVTELCAITQGAPGAKPTLYLRTVGDPSLRAADLSAMAEIARAQGFSEVGDVVVDDSDFDAVPYGPGWMWDDLSEGYSAPISATLVDENAATLTILPGRREGEPLRVLTTPSELKLPIVVQGRTVGPRGPGNVKITFGGSGERTATLVTGSEGPVPQADEPPDWALMPGQKIIISGTLPVDGPGRVRRLALGQPSAWTAQLVARLLTERGVAVFGKARRAQIPDGCLPIAKHSSAPLGTMLPVWMKASDNLAFEALGKRLGQVTTQKPGSFASGSQAVRQALSDTLLSNVQWRLVDASGTSRYNLLSPYILAKVLSESTSDFEMGSELLASLPLAGQDGTLARRLFRHRGRVRAKTGTMTGVSSLAGVLQAPDGERLAFAIMLEATLGAREKLRILQDHIVSLLADEVIVPLGEPPLR